MSLTYDEALVRSRTAVDDSAAFTPVYARAPVRRKGKMRTWMVLAPVGALTVAALGAWALMSPREDMAGSEVSAPAVINSAPVSGGLPVSADPMASAPAADQEGALTMTAEPIAEVDPAPVVSRASAPEPARAAPAPSSTASAMPAPEVVLSTGPQSYEAVTAAEAPAARAPTLSVAAESSPLIVIED